MNEYKAQIRNLKVERDTLVAIIKMLTGGSFKSKFDRPPIGGFQGEGFEDKSQIAPWDFEPIDSLVTSE